MTRVKNLEVAARTIARFLEVAVVMTTRVACRDPEMIVYRHVDSATTEQYGPSSRPV
jgi:hypothetical protein